MYLLEGLKGLEGTESQAKTKGLSPEFPPLVIIYIIIRVGSQHGTYPKPEVFRLGILFCFM